MQEPPNITDLHNDLHLAQVAYVAARDEANAAKSAENQALNALNAAQKKFDAAVEETRKSAPRDSDWGRVRISKP